MQAVKSKAIQQEGVLFQALLYFALAAMPHMLVLQGEPARRLRNHRSRRKFRMTQPHGVYYLLQREGNWFSQIGKTC